MAIADTLRGVITADASGVQDAVGNAKGSLDELDSRTQAVGQQMQSTGRKMTAGITAPVAAMGGMAVRQAANFDQAMQKSIAVMGDVDDAMREDLEATAREVATTTTRSHQETAESFYFLASAGLDAAEAMEALPEVAAFAEAGQMNMARATDVATNVMSAYGYEASEMTEVTDVLTATVSSHNQTMQGMSSAMSKAAPTAASLGVSIEETSAAIGMLGDVGIQAERAGTGLNAIMAQLSDSSSTASKQLQEAGVQVQNAQGEMLPLRDIIQQIEQSSLEASDAAQLFGREAGPAAAALIREGSDALAENTNRIDEMEGATQEMAATQRDTLNAELSMTKDRLNDAAITIGANVLPMVSTLAGYVAGAADAFGGLDERTQMAIVAMVGLAAVTGPTIWVLGSLVTSLSAVSGAATFLAGVNATALLPSLTAVTGAATGFAGTLTGTVIPAIVGTQIALGPVTVPIWALIAAAGALGAAWATNFLGIKDITDAAVGLVTSNLDLIWDYLRLLIGPIGWLHMAWTKNWLGIQDVTGDAAGVIGDVIDWLIKQINKIPGVDVEIGDIPGLDDITPSLPSASDMQPAGRELGRGVTRGMGDGLGGREFSAEDVGVPGESAMQSAGQSAGESFSTGLRTGVESTGAAVTATVTEELAALADETSIADSAEVGEDLYLDQFLLDELLGEMDSVTPETLGITQREFQRLRSSHPDFSPGSTTTESNTTERTTQPPGDPGLSTRHGVSRGRSSSSSGGGSTPAVVMSTQQTTTQSRQSSNPIVQKLEELRELLASLEIDGVLDVEGDPDLREVIDGRVRVRFSDERDKYDRTS